MKTSQDVETFAEFVANTNPNPANPNYFRDKAQKAIAETEAERDRWINAAHENNEWAVELQSENAKLRAELEWLTSRLYVYANHVERLNPHDIAKDLRAIASESERSVL